MKHPSLLTALLLSVLFIACGAPATQEQSVTSVPEPSPSTPASTMRCFRSVTTAGDGSYSDTMSITLRINNTDVEGRMDWLPGMKDRMRGTLKGTLEAGRITALYTYSAEGVQQTEQRVFKLGADNITVMSGEMEDRDGTLVMKDVANAVDGIRVPEVECAK
ncbi:MAG: hypothetical protein ACOH13_16130 [Flavobacteriales bacterium]